MTWTYSGDPSSSVLDEYRFSIGDTVSTQPVLQDEEILYITGKYEGEYLRLYKLYDKMADIFSRAVKRSLGPQSEDPTARVAYFAERAAYYRKLNSASSGLSQPKSTPIIFSKGMHDNVRNP